MSVKVNKKEIENLLECLAKTKELEASLIRRLWMMIDEGGSEEREEVEDSNGSTIAD